MMLSEILAKVTGFPVKDYRPLFYNSLKELFDILKEYCLERYGITDKSINNISFDMLSGVDIFSETVYYNKQPSIILGANTDMLFDWINCDQNNIDQDHYTLDSNILAAKVVCQKLLRNSRFHEASIVTQYIYSLINEYEKYNFKGISFINKSEEKHKTKIMQYIAMLAHEFGHILYKTGCLSSELKAINKYINSGIAFGHGELNRRLYIWLNTLNFIEKTTWERIQDNSIDLLKGEREKIQFNHFFSSNGQNETLTFFRKIKNNDRVKEELVCDLFAYNCMVDVLEFESGDYLYNLIKLQVFLTLAGYLFENIKLFNHVDSFFEGFARFITIIGLNTDRDTDGIYDNNAINYLLILYIFSKQKKLFRELSMLDMLLYNEKYKNFFEDMYDLSLIINN